MNESVEQTADGPLARDRKVEHIRLALRAETQSEQRFFDEYRLEHNPLPEMSLDDVDLSVEFLGRQLRAPLLISCMTGGTEAAERINRNLAIAAEECGVALGVGSQRKAVEGGTGPETFQLRRFAPSIPLLANLGAVQLNYGFGEAECRAAVEMAGADALVLHLNVLQEAIQPEGQTDFRGLLGKMGEVARALEVPVIAKEVGCGIPARVGRAFLDEGISIVDTAGLGGTSWARIEARRAGDVEIGEVFADWGIPTPDCIAQLAAVEGLTVIGSGGIRTGVEAAKAMALGADLVGIAQPFLAPALESPERVAESIRRTIAEM
ncbi:MAG: type 2 isopentenyl-diphosphate Delta-isomerase, partial [Gemmatimonadetes bacterium]|nr:type 2 isopentenyl-diphosphate Delta-isomerase [Gemmatimonadota bacterium]